MEIWVSGFNAWNQLQFDGELQAEPPDLQEFTCVLKDSRIELLKTSLTATVVRTSSGIHTAGYSDEFTKLCGNRDNDLLNVALAGNDKISEFTPEGIVQYDSLQAFTAQEVAAFESLRGIVQIASNQTGFTALSSSGTVYTWGDERYEACLGREIADETPASKPCIVDGVLDLPDEVMKISSGGYVAGALTAGNDIYLWGRQGHPELAEPLTASPTPLDLDGRDFLDVAVGMNHIIVLTTEREIFIVGAGGNGQLGLGSTIKELKDWREVKLSLRAGQRAVSVHAGYKNSFVIVGEVT